MDEHDFRSGLQPVLFIIKWFLKSYFSWTFSEKDGNNSYAAICLGFCFCYFLSLRNDFNFIIKLVQIVIYSYLN